MLNKAGFFGLLCSMAGGLNGQTLKDELVRAGMENVAVSEQENSVLVAVEDRYYRDSHEGVKAVWEVIRKFYPDQKVELMVTDRNGIPQVVLEWNQGELVRAHADVDSVKMALKGVSRTNRSAWKPDLVFYPSLFLENTSLDKLYRYAVGVAPAVECPLWTGAELTLQVIFPLLTNQKGQYEKIRPGILTLSQEIRLKKNVGIKAVVGNFTNNRFGLVLSANWISDNGRWNLNANLGGTVFSMVMDRQWMISRSVKLNALMGASYYLASQQTLLGVEGGRYVYGDYGAKAFCERHFGAYTVGLFVATSKRIINGGFCFSIPFPGKRWKRQGRIRIKPADYFSFDYSYSPPGEFTEENLMYEYRTTAHDERSKGWYQPDYLKHFLLLNQK